MYTKEDTEMKIGDKNGINDDYESRDRKSALQLQETHKALIKGKKICNNEARHYKKNFGLYNAKAKLHQLQENTTYLASTKPMSKLEFGKLMLLQMD